MDTIRGLPEVVDKGAREGRGCLEARSASMKDFVGLGPPDLCRMSKTSSGAPKEDVSFFHYVVGLDVADASRVSKYVTSVMGAQESAPWLSSIFEAEKWTIHGGVYCCYNAFQRIDVRVEVRIPGIPGVVEYGVDAFGNEVDLDVETWQGARLSAMLRSLEPPPQRLPALMALPMFDDHLTVEAFIELGSKNFKLGEKIGLTAYQGCGTHTLSEYLSRYLVSSRRLAQAVQVLWDLQEDYPSILLHVARAYVKNDQLDCALNIVSQALKDHPVDAPLLNYEAKLLLKRKDCEQLALEAAELAVQMQPTTWPFWVTLAKAFAKVKKYEKALLALNSPVLKLNRHDVENELGLPDLSSAEQTAPKSGPVHAGLFALKPDEYEPLPIGGEQFPGFGPGFGLNKKLDERITPGKVDAGEKGMLAALNDCPGASLSYSEARGYAVLVSVHNEVGWDALIEKQSNVILIMEEGTDKDCQPCGPNRTFSTKYFDRLFEALHGDLCLLDEWHEEQGSRTSSGSADLWLQRGALAERLQLDYDMELAFRIVQTRCVCFRASLRLLRLYIKRGEAESSVLQLSLLCGLTLSALRADHHPLLSKNCIPDWLFEAVAQVVCRWGMNYTRNICTSAAACAPFRDKMLELLAVVERAGIDGLQR